LENDEMMTRLLLLAFAATLTALAGCTAEQTPIDEARTAYFATADGTDEDCEDWLQWCLDEGYPQEGCEERNEYCVDGEWVGGDGDDADRPDDDDDRPDDDDELSACEEEAHAAERACLEDGGTDEECSEELAEALADCEDE